MRRAHCARQRQSRARRTACRFLYSERGMSPVVASPASESHHQRAGRNASERGKSQGASPASKSHRQRVSRIASERVASPASRAAPSGVGAQFMFFAPTPSPSREEVVLLSHLVERTNGRQFTPRHLLPVPHVPRDRPQIENLERVLCCVLPREQPHPFPNDRRG